MHALSAKLNRYLTAYALYLLASLVCYSAAMSTLTVVSSKAMGERIKFRRQDIGMSQERLAEVVEVSYQQIQRYESGRNRLNVENLQVIAHALGVPITYFFEPSTSSGVHEKSDSSNEKTLQKYFRQISLHSDKQAVILVAKRFAAKK